MDSLHFLNKYTWWPILIYNPKYLLIYFIYEKMIRTKVDQDQGGHLTVSSILTLSLIFKVKWRKDPFLNWESLFLTADLKRAGSFTSKITCGKIISVIFFHPEKPRQFRKGASGRFSDIWPYFFTFPRSQKPFFRRSFLTWNSPLFSNPQSKIGVLIQEKGLISIRPWKLTSMSKFMVQSYVPLSHYLKFKDILVSWFTLERNPEQEF